MANKIIEVKQCIIVRYASYNKAFHVNLKFIDELIIDLKVHFGCLVITRGEKHSFLGMNIEKGGEIDIDKTEHLEEVIEDCGEEISRRLSPPAQHHIFTVNDKAEKLDEERSEIFHAVTASLFYLMKWEQPNLEPLVSFLSTRISKSDVDDWKNLK